MAWFLFFVLAFGFGLGIWEFIAIKNEMKRHGSAAADMAKAAGIPLHNAYLGLPRAVKFPIIRCWIFAGQVGLLVIAVVGWWTTHGFAAGFLRVIELEVLYVIVGSLIGWGIWRATGASGSEPSP